MTDRNPQLEIERIITFLQGIFKTQGKSAAVIAVSGGIDSALSLSLLARAIPKEQIFPLFLPYADQMLEDSIRIARWNKIPEKNCETINIKTSVDLLCDQLQLSQSDTLRRGNSMARIRMIAVFDRAKQYDALVCGTENKSEHYLGYFTRFGDSASDIEPISHLYKTQVRKLVQFLDLPAIFLQKAPSAGLWNGQTDEKEMGFTYEEADQVIAYHLNEMPEKPNLSEEKIAKILQVVERNAFKLNVPYMLKE